MSQGSKIVPLAVALAALAGTTTVASPAEAKVTEPNTPKALIGVQGAKPEPNTLARVGEDYLGFVVSKAEDGTVVAWHSSHASHASHASHSSHYSSRY